MTLHKAIEQLLQLTGRPMTTVEIADELNKRNWYREKDKSPITDFQIHGRTRKYSQLFGRNGSTVSLIGEEPIKKAKDNQNIYRSSNSTKTLNKDEHYVLDLCDKILNIKSSRQHKFDFLVGDANAKGLAARLPVDAYYQKLNIVIEYREKQHTESVSFFDKPNCITVSGVHRGLQRKIYDEKRRILLPKNGLTLIEISYSDFGHNRQKRIIRDEKHDVKIIKKILQKYLDKI